MDIPSATATVRPSIGGEIHQTSSRGRQALDPGLSDRDHGIVGGPTRPRSDKEAEDDGRHEDGHYCAHREQHTSHERFVGT